jgi:phosphatidylglycerol:prolipoprotein diacylglycerol transferase
MHWTGNPSVHFAFEIAGYVAGAITYIFVRGRRGDAVDDRTRAAVLVGATVGAMIGSRLLYWLCDVDMNPLSGKTIVGGLLGGLIGVEIAKKSIGIQHHRSLETSVPLLRRRRLDLHHVLPQD